MLLAVFRYDFLDVNTMALIKYLIPLQRAWWCNRRDKITYCNGGCRTLAGAETGDDMEPLRRILREKADVIVRILRHHLRWKIMVKGEGWRSGSISRDKEIWLREPLCSQMGRYYQLLEQGRELAVTNQSLAIEKERNRIARRCTIPPDIR